MGNKNFLEYTKQSIEKYVVDNCTVADCIIGEVSYSTGLSEWTPLFVCKQSKKETGEIVQHFEYFSEISNIKQQIGLQYSERPSFHVYVCPLRQHGSRTTAPIDKQLIIKKIAEQMANIFITDIIQELEEIKKSFQML